jgi:trans-aconitate methyltransferase
MDLVEAASHTADVGVRHPWETARLEVVKRLIATHAQLGNGSVVVDIGCGDAFVAGALAKLFPQSTFYGVDSGLTPDLIAEIRQRVGATNLHLSKSLDEVTAERSASLVLLMDVIEHIEDDAGFLADLLARRLIDRRSCLLVTVPAYQRLFSAHDIVLRHYRRYSNRSLRRRLEHAGLEVVESSYFFLSLLPLRALQVLKEQLFGRPPVVTSDLTIDHGRASSAFLSRALVADASVSLWLRRVGITLPGLSNYAICRKSA